MKYRLLFVLALCLSLGWNPARAADPTLSQVYQAAASGQLAEAEKMMAQVLRDHPNSAKAHFVEAELMAKAGRIEAARSELATAERLAPGLPFAKPAAVTTLQQHLSASHTNMLLPAAAAAPAAAHQPWGLIMVGAAVVLALLFFLRALQRRQRSALATASGNAGYAPAGGPGFPPTGGGMGSGILGGLATGAAVGAGMVAGEALMHRVLDGSHDSGTLPASAQGTDPAMQPDPGYDLGGQEFGVNDSATWDSSDSWADSDSLGGDDWS